MGRLVHHLGPILATKSRRAMDRRLDPVPRVINNSSSGILSNDVTATTRTSVSLHECLSSCVLSEKHQPHVEVNVYRPPPLSKEQG